MRLDKLIIKQLPGIDEKFVLSDLETVNLIHGPNGSGKSSLTRAISQLLWKDISTGSPFSVEAIFLNGKDRWRASRDTRENPKWTLNGDSKNPLPLPMGHIADCYKMGVLDLVLPAGEEVEMKLANTINIEMYGGIDLEKVKDSLFAAKPKRANDPSNKLDAAIRVHSELITAQTQLAKSQDHLPDLKKELERKNQALIKLNLLKNFVNREEHRVQLQNAQSNLDQFSSGQGNTLKNDAVALEGWLQDDKKNHQKIEKLDENIEIRQKKIQALDFPSDALEKTDPSYLATQISDAIERQGLVDSLATDLRSQEVLLGELIQELSPEVVSDSADQEVPKEIYQKMSSQYSFLTSHLAQIEGWKEVQAKLDLPESPELPDHEDLNRALRNWLEGRAGKEGIGHLVLIALGLVVLPVGYWEPYALLLSVPLLCAGLFQWRKISSRHQKLTEGAIAQCRIAGLDLPEPFTATDVVELLKGTAHAAGIEQTQVKLAEVLTEKLQSLTGDSKENTSQINDLTERFGSSLTDSHIEFLRYLDRMPDFRTARNEVARLQKELLFQEDKLEEEFKLIADSFGNLGLDKPQDTRNAQHLLSGLQGRLSELKDLNNEQTIELNQLENLKSNQATTLINLEQLWKRLSIEPQNDAQLVQTMVGNIPAWDDAKGQTLKYQTMFDSENKTFCSRPDLLKPEDVESLSSQELDDMISKLEDDKQTRDEDVIKIDRIEEDLKAALAGSRVAEAQARSEKARSLLLKTRETERESLLGQLLLDDIGETYHRNFQPEVLARAAEYFSAFTHNTYELRVRTGKENKGQFYAFEHDTEKSYGLAQLSDGTRAQLLLAVRLAFITVNEGEARPPLFLDESLTASDPVRFATIAINLSQWAHDHDRQIFYLSSNPGDAEAWKAALDTVNLPTPKLIDLAQVRGAAAGLAADIHVAIPELATPPGNSSALKYARHLKVPQLDGWKNHNETHLWHLLGDDLPLLHRLVVASTSTFGRWNAHQEAMKTLAGMTDEGIRMLAARGHCLEVFFRNWRIGRGKLLTGDVLADSGIISKTYLEKCRIQLSRVQGDAMDFLTALRDKKVPRFREDNIRLLEEHFLQEGFIDRQEILSADELVGSVSVAVTAEIDGGHLSVALVRELVLSWNQSIQSQELI